MEIGDWVYYHRVTCDCVTSALEPIEETGLRVVTGLAPDLLPYYCEPLGTGASWWHRESCVYKVHKEML